VNSSTPSWPSSCLLGLLGLRPLGVAAGIGLALFFLGAFAVHVRNRVFHNIAVPGTFFALAIASAVLAVAASALVTARR
jgi:hypothetical protein